MRRSWCLLSVLLTGPALADPPPAYRAQVEKRAAVMFDLADGNHDAVLTKAEFIAATVAIAKARGGTPTPQGIATVEAQFDAYDAKHQGRISRADFLSEKMAQFDAMDLNHDGVVSADEARKAAIRLRAQLKAERDATRAKP